MRQRRFENHPQGRRAPVVLPPDHPAIREARPLFPGFVGKRVLRAGVNSRKIGARVTKGRWAGSRIFTLTLPERTTCPATCAHWFDCYGNNMPHPIRNAPGPALERGIEAELAEILADGPALIRLHLLGDFYAVDYVEKWAAWLGRWPQLRVFGYTAWGPETAIGGAVWRTITAFEERFKIRFSDGPPTVPRTISIPLETDAAFPAIICPAQTHPRRDEICCATCALCWNTDRPIAFIDHGNINQGE